jgi:hypothetical protein
LGGEGRARAAQQSFKSIYRPYLFLGSTPTYDVKLFLFEIFG